MKLVAVMLAGPGERDRYLDATLTALGEFCDDVMIVSEDPKLTGRNVLNVEPGSFFAHEGRARNVAIQWAMEAKPTHLLAVDADEFVTDGQAVRRACMEDKGRGVWSLGLEEVWKADERNLWVREDGGWRMQERGIPILWRAPSARLAKTTAWQVADRALACGREPMAVRRIRPIPSGSQILHFGWTCEADRAARHARYVEHDGGRFHRNAHLDSIMWDDAKVKLRRRSWPTGLDRAAILARTQPVTV